MQSVQLSCPKFKIPYSCMPNIAAIIESNNKKKKLREDEHSAMQRMCTVHLEASAHWTVNA